MKANVQGVQSVSCLIAHVQELISSCNQAMLTEIYISALQVDEKLADQVWEAWDSGGLMMRMRTLRGY